MFGDKKTPEDMPPAPDFIKVTYDERGRPIGMKAVEGVSELKNEPSQKGQNPGVKVQLNAKPMERDVVVSWIANLSSQIKVLRDQLRSFAIFSQKKFNEFQPIVANAVDNSFSKYMDLFNQRIDSIESEVLNLKHQFDMGDFTNVLGSIEGEISYLKNQNDLDSEGLKVVAENVVKMNSHLSNLAREIENSNLNEIQTVERLKAIADETDNVKVMNWEAVQRLSIVEDEIKALREDLITEIATSIFTLSIKQEELIKNLFDRMNKKFKAGARKKRVVRRQNRAKITRLLRKLKLKNFDNVLIVSDKRNAEFSAVIFDVARKINKRAVLAVMENRKVGGEPEDSAVQAMRQSDFIITVGRLLDKTVVLQDCIAQGKKIVAIKKSLRIKELS